MATPIETGVDIMRTKIGTRIPQSAHDTFDGVADP